MAQPPEPPAPPITPSTVGVTLPVQTPDQDGHHLRRVAVAYVKLPHAGPIAVVLVATAGFAILVLGRLPPLDRLAPLLLAMLGGQLAIGAVNELVDAELDAATKPWKPIPAGLVTPRGAWIMTALGLGLMLVAGWRFGAAAIIMLVGGTALGIAYDLWFKRSRLSWLPYVLALPLLPIWVRTALVGFDARLLLLYPLGALATVGVHLAQTLPDAESDRAAGLRNLVSRLGSRRALVACWLAALSAPVLAVAAVALRPDLVARPEVVLVAAATDAALIVGNAVAAARNPAVAVRTAFACVAAGTVVMGIGWVLAVG